MNSLAATLPQGIGSGYVAAAYIVFFAIVLIYVAIMAIRLSRVERDVRELHVRAGQPPQQPPQPAARPGDVGEPQLAEQPQLGARPRRQDETHGQTPEPHTPVRERETV